MGFETLLEVFLVSHDPTTLNRQGNDVGTQYRSAVFCQDAEQYAITEQTIEAFNSAFLFNAPIVTEINGSSIFYPAEDYHQYYFDKNPNQPYCMAVAGPKVAKIRAKYAQLIK